MRQRMPIGVSSGLLRLVLVAATILTLNGGCGGGEEPIRNSKFAGCVPGDDPTGLTPSLRCVATVSGGQTYAVFGYDNKSGKTLRVPLGPTNIFVPDPAGRGQPTIFDVGPHTAEFATPLDQPLITWKLGSTSVSASFFGSPPKCPVKVTPDGAVAVLGKDPLDPSGTTDLTIALEAKLDKTLGETIVDTETAPDPHGQKFVTAGAVPGELNLTASGAATYSIPLEIPPGRAGAEPTLALEYNSGAGNGPMGVGWGLSGLSQIARCNKTHASPNPVTGADGEATAIKFDGSDRLCLDNDYLIGVPDLNGRVSEYRPEHSPFVRVIPDATDSLGPTSFTVFLKNGRIRRYGTGGALLQGDRTSCTASMGDTAKAVCTFPGAARYAWLYSQEEDRSGNGLYIEYRDPNVSCRSFPGSCKSYELLPIAIHYSTRSSDAPKTPGGIDRPSKRSIRFVYNDEATRPRADQNVVFISGFALRLEHLLMRIEMWAPAPDTESLIRAYNLYYQGDRPGSVESGSISGRSLLQAVEQCDAKGVCVEPTVFGWESGDIGFIEMDTKVTDVAKVKSKKHYGVVTADINGDGNDDLLWRETIATNPAGIATLQWFYRLGMGSGFGERKPTNLPAQTEKEGAPVNTPRPVDIDGDGHADLAFPMTQAGGTPAFWKFFRFNGTDFEALASTDEAEEKRGCIDKVCIDPGAGMYAGDLDGDGLPEFLHAFGPPPVLTVDLSALMNWGLRRNKTGTLTSPIEVLQDGSGKYWDVDGNWNAFVADLDGSGKNSFLFAGTTLAAPTSFIGLLGSLGTRYSAARMNGPTGLIAVEPTTLINSAVPDGPKPDGQHPFFLDLNGDGVADILSLPNAGGYPELAINTANGFPGTADAVDPGPLKTPAYAFGSFPNDSGARAIDFNQDGRSDVLLLGYNQAARVTEGLASGIIVYVAGFSGGVGGRYLLRNSGQLVSETEGSPGTTTTIPALDYAVPELALSQVLDANGDGLADIIEWAGGTLKLYLRAGKKADMMTFVRNGYGAKTHIRYSATNAAPPTPCPYPTYCGPTRGLWVVSGYDVDSGKLSGLGVKSFAVTYSDARQDLAGRGFLGFGKRTIQDTAFLQTWTTEYDNVTRQGTAYPFAGIPKAEFFDADIASGKHFRHTKRVHYDLRGDPSKGQPFSVLPFSEEELDEETDFGITRHFTTELDYDAYDNLKLYRRKALLEGSESETTAEYYNLPASWLFGLPHFTHAREATSGGLAVTRTTEFAPNFTTGLLDSATSEPGAGPNISLRTKYVRNRDGLVVGLVATDLTSGESHETDTQYDPSEGIFPIATTNSEGHITRLQYHPGLGLIASRILPNGFSSKWQYDGFGRIRAKSNADGSSRSISYVKETFGFSVDTRDTSGGYRRITYDQIGREVVRDSNGLDGRVARREIHYDSYFLDQPSFTRQPYYLGDTTFIETDYFYDQVGRVVQEQQLGGGTTYFKYEGLKTTVKDPRGAEKVFVADELGRTTSATDVVNDEGGRRELKTTYRYAPFGQLDQVIDTKGNTTKILYDIRGRRTYLKDPDAGEFYFTHDAFGQLLTQLDGGPSVTEYGYDSIGRPIGTKNADGVSCFYYDESRSSMGALTQMDSADGVRRRFTFDLLGRPSSESWAIAGSSYALVRSYDTVGRLKTLQYPSVLAEPPVTTLFTYWPSGFLQSVTAPSLSWQANARDAANRLIEEEFGNKLKTTRHYDTLSGTEDSIVTGDTGTKVQDIAYTYYLDGTVKSREDRLATPGTKAGLEGYTYDELKRLHSWSHAGSWEVAYTYNDIGNLLSRSLESGGSKSTTAYGYADKAGPHALTSVTDAVGSTILKYDGLGNQTNGLGQTVTFTSQNLPRSIEVASLKTEFSYDAIGTRAQKRSPTLTTSYVGNLYERRVTSARTEHVFHVYAGGAHVADVVWTEVAGAIVDRRTLYLHTDSLNSISTITDNNWATSKKPVEQFRYDPFGRRVSPTDPTSTTSAVLTPVNDGFNGHEHDDDYGLINMYGRSYDPRIGRFLSVDPSVGSPFLGQALNRYSYAWNSPTNFLDPTGFDVEGTGGTGGGGGSGGSWGGGEGGVPRYYIPAVPRGPITATCIGWVECGATMRKAGATFSAAAIEHFISDDLGSRSGTAAGTYRWNINDAFVTCNQWCSGELGRIWKEGWPGAEFDGMIQYALVGHALVIPWLKYLVAAGLTVSIMHEGDIPQIIPAITMLPELPKPPAALVPVNGTVSVGGATEPFPRLRTNLNPLLDRKGDGIKNLVVGYGEDMGEIFATGSVKHLVSRKLPYSTVNWEQFAKSAHKAMARGAVGDLDVWMLQEDNPRLVAAFKNAGFRSVEVVPHGAGTLFKIVR